MPNYLTNDELAHAKGLLDRMTDIYQHTVVGQEGLRRALTASLLAGGHVLVESVPGLAKTTAAQTLASAVSGTFHRIQCTPDLMPNDIVGSQIWNQERGEMVTQLARFTPTWSSWMRSTVPPRRPSPRCWRPCRNARPPLVVSITSLPSPLHGHGHAEPHRGRRHLHSA